MSRSSFGYPYDSTWFYDFQTPATGMAKAILHFHHDLMVILVFICFFVLFLLIRVFQKYSVQKEAELVLTRKLFSFNYFKHQNILLEIIWTVFPALILAVIAVPSFALLYASSVPKSAEITLKVIGHQWYWSQSISDFPVIMKVVDDAKVLLSEIAQTKNKALSLVNDNSAFLFNEDLKEAADKNKTLFLNEDLLLTTETISKLNDRMTTKERKNKKHLLFMSITDPSKIATKPRLLTTQKVLALPSNTCIRAVVTSEDVLHSWAIPSFGIKIDACPGRLNSIKFIVNRTGLFTGACSELCGVNHAFMPFNIRVLSFNNYLNVITYDFFEDGDK